MRAHEASCSSIKGKRTVDSFHRELGKIMWEYCGMARNDDGLQTGARADSGAARGVLERRQRAGQRRGAEPVAREGRPRGRFLRARRADVPATRWSATNLRRPFPRGVSDAGRRSAARRREFLLRRRLGVSRARASRRCCTKSRSSSKTCTSRSGATSNESDAARLAADERRRHGPDGRATRRTDVSPDMSFLEMLDVVNERLDREGRGAGRVRSRLPRRHLRHRAAHDQRRGARPDARHGDVPAPHAPLQEMASDITSSRGARRPSR